MGISELTATQKFSGSEKALDMDTAVQASAKRTQQPQPNQASIQDLERNAKNTRLATKDKLQRIATAMAEYVQSIQRDLRIKIDDKTESIVIQVVSKNNGKVIRQIPPEEMLKLAAKMEEMVGVIFNKSA